MFIRVIYYLNVNGTFALANVKLNQYPHHNISDKAHTD